MQSVSTSTPVPVSPVGAPAPTPSPAPAADGVGGVRGGIADFIRASGAGYATAANQEAVVVDKAAIHPFETVATATALLRDKTANIKGVNKATSLLHTIGGFAMLILTANVSGALRSPGHTAQDVANHVADAIDGRKTARGWALGWGVRTPEGEDVRAPQGGIGAALARAGVK